MRTALVVLLLAAPLGGLLTGTAAAEPYLPPGAPVPATGTITREATSPLVKGKTLRAPVVRSRPAPVRSRARA